MARKRRQTKNIAYQDGIIARENGLQLPIVYYPGHYGAFFAFGQNENSEISFCSCTKKAITNYIRFRVECSDSIINSDHLRNFILSKSKFPQQIVITLIEQYKNVGHDIIEQLNFENEICHECNKITPSYSYCDPMYGGVFEQNFGWYINKQSLEYGVLPVSFKILEDICPDEVFSLLECGKKEFLAKYNGLSETDLIMSQASDSYFQKCSRRIRTIIENEVRVKFGFKKVGEAWATETLLYQFVCQIFPEDKICRHYRPDFLEYLELDVFIPSLNVGMEYQGIQHFEPVEHWGGKDSLNQVIERDKKKKKLCSKNGIKLIYFYYYEDLSMELVEGKLKNIS
ncbi:MAG: hypothetical protein Q8J86_11090 [Desulfurivibrionaceae bacterium]|nr:hypothetical protein [Desulfurivibrionaceae bacterium]